MAQEAQRPQPQWYVGRTASGFWERRHPARPPGYRLQPARPLFFCIDNWLSPLLPTSVVSQPQGRGLGQRGGEDGKSECRPVIGRRGPHRRRSPPRKGADFGRVLTGESLERVRPLGEVRGWRNPLNGPRDIRTHGRRVYKCTCRAFQARGLEPDEGKPSRPVRRGLEGGNTLRRPGGMRLSPHRAQPLRSFARAQPPAAVLRIAPASTAPSPWTACAFAGSLCSSLSAG